MRINICGFIITMSLLIAGDFALAADPFLPPSPADDPVPAGGADLPVPPPPAPAVSDALEEETLAPIPSVAAEIAPQSVVAPPVIVRTDYGHAPISGACPYCGDPNCPRVSRKATHSERIKSGLREHLCPGTPGHRLTPRPPAGSRLHAIMGWQRANGQAAQQVLYHYDFLADTARLNIRGQQRLHEIAVRAMRNGFPIIIQPTPRRPELEQGRWETVVEFLSRFDVPIDPAQVIVAQPPARPLEGLEILPAYQGLLTIPGSAGGIPAGGGPIAPPIVP